MTAGRAHGPATRGGSAAPTRAPRLPSGALPELWGHNLRDNWDTNASKCVKKKAEEEDWRREGRKSRLDGLKVGYTPAVATSWTEKKRIKRATINDGFQLELVKRFANL